MMREYELTDEEYRTVTAALEYAAENAVHPDGELTFKNLHRELMKQYEHHEPHKATESDRLGDSDG